MVASKTADGNASQVTGHVGAELRRFGVQGEGAPLKVVSRFEPAGDQPQAIEKLARGVREGLRYQTLMGVTGSGKTFTMAKTIEAVNKPTLILEPNKTLAAQVASPRPTSRSRTPTSRRTPPSTRRSRSCATRPRRACCPAATSSAWHR